VLTDRSDLSPIERTLALFTRIRPGEGRTLLLFFTSAFLFLFSYYILKALREAFLLSEFSAEVRAYALAAIALLAITVDPTEPTRYAEFAYNLLLIYDLHSFAVLLLLKFWPDRAVRLGPLLHAIDLVWAVSVTFLTEGPNSSFFALFVFVLLAAATRWGFRETVLTGLVTVLLFGLETAAVSLGLVNTILEISSLIMSPQGTAVSTLRNSFSPSVCKRIMSGSTPNERTRRLARVRLYSGKSIRESSRD
jgi:hypothetical protein